MNKRIIPLIVGLAAVWGQSGAQEVLTLQEAVATALRQNTSVMVARNSAVIAQNTASAGKADLLPKLSASAGANYTDIENVGASTTSSVGASASYTLFDGLGNVYRLRQAQSTGRLGALDARNQIESTVLQVGQAYYTAASAFESLRIAREALGISRERLVRAQERSAYGRAGTVDVLSAQVDVNADSVTVVQSQLAWDQARRNLNMLLFREIGAPLAVATGVDYAPMAELGALLSEAQKRNAGFLIYQERTRQAKAAAGAAGSALAPKLDLSGSATYSQTDADLAVGFGDLGYHPPRRRQHQLDAVQRRSAAPGPPVRQADGQEPSAARGSSLARFESVGGQWL